MIALILVDGDVWYMHERPRELRGTAIALDQLHLEVIELSVAMDPTGYQVATHALMHNVTDGTPPDHKSYYIL
jgi:hypothetical protein